LKKGSQVAKPLFLTSWRQEMSDNYWTISDYRFKVSEAMKPVIEAENAKPFIWDDYLAACHRFYEKMKFVWQ
jgi:hypothetical protein